MSISDEDPDLLDAANAWFASDASAAWRGAEAEFGDAVAEAFGQAFDEAVEAQAAQLISDGALGDLFWGATGEGGKVAAQIVATEALCDLAACRTWC